MEHILHPLILWLHLHPNWAGFVTFCITLFESLAIIGLIIPGSVTLSAIGGLVGGGVVPAVDIFTWAIAGAILGDGLSYWLGYRYHTQIRTMWPISRFPKLVTQGEDFFAKHGGKGIFLGRFIGPIRPIMPLVAGMLRVPPRKFFLVDVISGIFWAPVYMIPGIIVGAAAAKFAPGRAMHYLMILLLIIFVLWLVLWLSKIFIHSITFHWMRLCTLIWQQLKAKNTLLYRMLYEHDAPNQARPLSIAIFSAAFFILCLLLLGAILVKAHWIITLNHSDLSFFQSLHSSLWQGLALSCSMFLGKYSVILSTAVLISAYLAIVRDWHALWYLWLTLILSVVCIVIGKHAIHSIRPDVVIAPPATYSLPSGHTLMSLTFFSYLAFLIAHRQSSWLKKVFYWLASLIVLVVALSRLYLNVHWLSDIVVSLLLGASILGVVVLFYRCSERANTYKNVWLVMLLILGQAVFGGFYAHKHYASLMADFRLQQPTYALNVTTWWQTPHSILPLYHHNRFNNPVQLMNVQWLANNAAITHSLIKQGWEIPQRFGLHSLKQQLLGKNLTVISPLPQNDKGRKPALVLVKPLQENTGYLILRLWQAHYVTAQSTLYIGNISYHLPLKHWLWHSKQQCQKIYPASINVLRQQLTLWHTKAMPVKVKQDLPKQHCVPADTLVLKIRQ
jgi:undecaprenyl-diphosphatase